MRCPFCGGDFPKLTDHVHDPEGLAYWDREAEKQRTSTEKRLNDAKISVDTP